MVSVAERRNQKEEVPNYIKLKIDSNVIARAFKIKD